MIDATQEELKEQLGVEFDEGLNTINLNKVSTLLEKLEIVNIVSVDDDWIIKKENQSIFEILQNVETNNKEKEQVFKKILEKSLILRIEIDEEDGEKFNKELVLKLIDISSYDEFTSYLDTIPLKDLEIFSGIIEKYIVQDRAFQTNEENLKKIGKLLGSLETRGYNIKILDRYLEDFHKNLEGKTLWLLDRDMHGSREHIFMILKAIIEKKDVALIVTNDDGELESREKIGEFVNTHSEEYVNLDTSTLWVLKKDKIETEELAFAIRNVLQGFLIHNINDIQKSIHSRAIEKAEKYLKIIDPSDYDKYFSISYFEGSHINETIFRIKDALTNQFLHDSLSEPSISKELLGYRKLLERLNQDNIKELEGEQEQRLSNLAENDRVVKIHSFEQWEYSVNTMAYPIYTGDLFSTVTINSKKMTWNDNKTVYLLITQPCDTMIRKVGERIGRNAKNGLLIKGEFHTYGTKSYKKAITNQSKNKFKVHFLNHNNNYGIVEFDAKDVQQIDCRVLDLCSLDAQGISRLDKNNLDRADLMPALSYQYYRDQLDSFIDMCFDINNEKVEAAFKKLLKESKGDEQTISLDQQAISQFKRTILEEMKLNSIKNELILPQSVNMTPGFGFNLRRVARLKDPYTLDIINKSTDYLTRQGMPTIMI